MSRGYVENIHMIAHVLPNILQIYRNFSFNRYDIAVILTMVDDLASRRLT